MNEAALFLIAGFVGLFGVAALALALGFRGRVTKRLRNIARNFARGQMAERWRGPVARHPTQLHQLARRLRELDEYAHCQLDLAERAGNSLGAEAWRRMLVVLPNVVDEADAIQRAESGAVDGSRHHRVGLRVVSGGES